MDFNTTIDIILKDLRDVREIIEDLKNYPGMPQLQIEVASSKCRSAEEIIALLKTLKPSVKEAVAKAKPDVVVIPVQVTSEPVKKTGLESAPVEPGTGSNIFADKFTGAADTVFDKFESIKKEDDLSTLLRTRPVDNLADAIGLNDKFLFIREIFKGSHTEYDQAVSKLNKAESLPDAKAIIMSYTGENEESEVVRQLLEIVKRKIPSDG